MFCNKFLFSILSVSTLSACGGSGEKTVTPLPVETPVVIPSTPTKLTNLQLAIKVNAALALYNEWFTHITTLTTNELVMFRDTHTGVDKKAIKVSWTSSGKVTTQELNSFQVPRGTLTADFNQDSILDIYAFSHGRELPDQVSDKGYKNTLFWGSTNEYTAVDTVAEYTHSACTTDINGDGYPDIVDNNVYHHKPIQKINNGDETFQEHKLPKEIENTSYTWCTGADVNNDGYGDIIFGGNGNEYHTVVLSNGHKLKEVINLPFYDAAHGSASVSLLAKDIDMDGCIDVMSHVTNYDTESLIITYTGDCTGNFEVNSEHRTTYPLAYNLTDTSMGIVLTYDGLISTEVAKSLLISVSDNTVSYNELESSTIDQVDVITQLKFLD